MPSSGRARRVWCTPSSIRLSRRPRRRSSPCTTETTCRSMRSRGSWDSPIAAARRRTSSARAGNWLGPCASGRRGSGAWTSERETAMMADADPIDLKGLKSALAPSGACATVEQLSRLCDADYAGSADARLAEHVAGCVRCRTELALLKQFESAALRPGEETTASKMVARLERDVAQMIGSAPTPSVGEARERGGGFRGRLLAFGTGAAGGPA